MTEMENKYLRLSNDIVESLSRKNLTAYEWRVLMCIFRKTYGYQKKEDWIAPVQVVEMTGIHKAHVSRALRLLKMRNMVTPRGNKIGFNKYSNQWKELPNGVTNHSVTPRGTKVTQRGISELPHGADTKDNVTKDTIQKTSSPTSKKATEIDIELSKVLCDGIHRVNPAAYQKYPPGSAVWQQKISAWAEDIEKMRRIDNAEASQIRLVIAWLYGGTIDGITFSGDDFWKTNILSGATLRKQWERLVGKVAEHCTRKPKNSAVFIS